MPQGRRTQLAPKDQPHPQQLMIGLQLRLHELALKHAVTEAAVAQRRHYEEEIGEGWEDRCAAAAEALIAAAAPCSCRIDPQQAPCPPGFDWHPCQANLPQWLGMRVRSVDAAEGPVFMTVVLRKGSAAAGASWHPGASCECTHQLARDCTAPTRRITPRGVGRVRLAGADSSSSSSTHAAAAQAAEPSTSAAAAPGTATVSFVGLSARCCPRAAPLYP